MPMTGRIGRPGMNRGLDNGSSIPSSLVVMLAPPGPCRPTGEHASSLPQGRGRHSVQKRAARKAWIHDQTLKLMEDRQIVWISGDHALERELHKAVRKAAKVDRGAWLDDVVQEGTWQGIKTLKRSRRVQQGRLRGENGELVSSEHRAYTLATYLQQV